MSTPRAKDVVDNLTLADLMLEEVPRLLKEPTFKLFGDYLVSEADFANFLQTGADYPHGLITIMRDRLGIGNEVDEMLGDAP